MLALRSVERVRSFRWRLLTILVGDFPGIAILVNRRTVAVRVTGFERYGLSADGTNGRRILQYDHVLSNQDWYGNLPVKACRDRSLVSARKQQPDVGRDACQ